jgi:hypothetical protein
MCSLFLPGYRRVEMAGDLRQVRLDLVRVCLELRAEWLTNSQIALDQYLMADRNAEIALAQSAAPEAISRDARILVLGRHGYETASEGKNGLVCVVERGWMSPADAPEFWNPKLRGPICFNPPAARSVLPTTLKRTEMVLAGKTKAEMVEGNKAAFEKGELPPLEPGAMSYMMSKDAYLTDGGGHNLAHLMFYTPPLDGKAWAPICRNHR